VKPIFLATLISLSVTAAPALVEIPLGTGAPSGNPEDNPSLTVYLPEKEKANGAGVVVVPGGSFLIRCEDHEGRQVAKWLAARGITAFVVHYRLIPRFTMQEELDDVRHAVQMARSRAGEFGVHRIGMIGFSAGAYLTGEAALKPWEANPLAHYFVEKATSHVDFMALVYGAPGGTNDPVNGFNRFFAEQVGMENWRKLTATTPEQIAKAPPTFMFCTVEDRGAARRMGEFHLQLLQQDVSSEAHFFASGPHGVGFAQNDPILGEWPNLFYNWMSAKGFLANSIMLGVSGILKVDGKPLELGYVVFTPKDTSTREPGRTAYVFNRSGEKGAFKLSGQGLAPGEYDATVYQMAAKWNSVWAEPLLNRIQAKLNSGEKLSETEITDWKSWAAARHYEATLPDLVQYKPVAVKIGPESAENLVIDASP
jgi:acetyl esterase/lipase